MTLHAQITQVRDRLESIRGYALWINAPTKTVDAVQSALDALNEVLLERDKEKSTMKELQEMLAKYETVKEIVKGTSERLDKIESTCAGFNAGLDAFFADANDALAELEDAAPNGDLSDGGAQITGEI